MYTWWNGSAVYTGKLVRLRSLQPLSFGSGFCKLKGPCAGRTPPVHFKDLTTETEIGPSSRKHTYIILTPLKPHFYIVKLGFTWVYIIFLISAQKHRLWYSLEPPHQGSSSEYPQSMFRAEITKISGFFYLKNFILGGKIFSIFE